MAVLTYIQLNTCTGFHRPKSLPQIFQVQLPLHVGAGLVSATTTLMSHFDALIPFLPFGCINMSTSLIYSGDFFQ